MAEPTRTPPHLAALAELVHDRMFGRRWESDPFSGDGATVVRAALVILEEMGLLSPESDYAEATAHLRA